VVALAEAVAIAVQRIVEAELATPGIEGLELLDVATCSNNIRALVQIGS